MEHTSQQPKPLTHRQIQYLQLVVDGLTNKQIARALCVSTATVNKTICIMFLKTDTSSRTALAVFALRSHLID